MSALGQNQTCAVQNGMSALPPKADINITSRKAAPVAAFQMMWLSTAGQLLRAAIFLAFCHIANLRTAFAVAGICLVFFSGISRCCDEHGYCQGSEQSCKQFHCFPHECCRSTSGSVATCTKWNKASVMRSAGFLRRAGWAAVPTICCAPRRNDVYVRFGSKADMCSALPYVRFVPIGDSRFLNLVSRWRVFDRCQLPAALVRSCSASSSHVSAILWREAAFSLPAPSAIAIHSSAYCRHCTAVRDTSPPSAYAAFPIAVSKFSHVGHSKVCRS